MQIGGNPDAGGRQWLGIIDDVAIWDRALTDAEVADIYNGGTGASIASLTGIDTTPTASSGSEEISSFSFNADDEVELALTGLVPGREYQLIRTQDLSLDFSAWDVIGGIVTGETDFTFTDPAPPTGEAYYTVLDVTDAP